MRGPFPRLDASAPLAGLNELRDPDRFGAAKAAAGFADVRIVEVTNDYLVAPAMLDDPDHLFYFSPLWKQLDAELRIWQRCGGPHPNPIPGQEEGIQKVLASNSTPALSRCNHFFDSLWPERGHP